MLHPLQALARVALLLCLVSSLAGCATPVMPTTSGFLGGPDAYAGMEPSTRIDGVWADRLSGRSLRTLQMVLLEPIEVVPAPGSRITPETLPLAEEMARAFHGELVRALEHRYPVVRNPGPFVMRVRAAITDIEIVDGALGRGATMEAEVQDARSGQRLAAVVATAEAGRGGNALDVARAWALALRARIDAEHLDE